MTPWPRSHFTDDRVLAGFIRHGDGGPTRSNPGVFITQARWEGPNGWAQLTVNGGVFVRLDDVLSIQVDENV